MEPLDPDALAEVSALRPNRRPLWIAIGANTLVAIVFLGLPYLHGRIRAARSVGAFGDLAACLYGGTPTREGLALPPGERQHLAARTFDEASDWPERCRRPLARVVEQETLTVWPDVRGAEAQARRAVALVDEELSVFTERRAAGLDVVPSRPALALGRLQAALTILMDEAGMTEPGREALRFGGPARTVEPARIPVAVTPGSTLTMVGRGDGVTLAAVGPRRVAQVEVGGGRTTLRWVRRPRLVRALVPGPTERWLVWAMLDAQCAAQGQDCAGRATGIAPLTLDDSVAPAPRWLAGHPAGDVAASLTIDPDYVHMLARGADGFTQVRRFTLPEADDARDDDAPRPPPIRAQRSWPLGALVGQGRLLPGTPPQALALVATEAAVTLTLTALDELAAPTVLATLDPGPQELLLCDADAGLWLGVRSPDGVVFGRLLEGHFTSLGQVCFDGADQDELRLVCDAERAHLLRAHEGVLAAWSITAAGTSERREVARDVGDFDAARDGVTLVAFDAGPEGPQVRVRLLGDDAEPRGAAVAPAGCWEREGGLCGAPSVSANNGRILIAAWQGSDLRVVETSDQGRTFRAMRGVR